MRGAVASRPRTEKQAHARLPNIVEEVWITSLAKQNRSKNLRFATCHSITDNLTFSFGKPGVWKRNSIAQHALNIPEDNLSALRRPVAFFRHPCQSLDQSFFH